ncbi:DUF6204 family protein [Nonomuraea sp. NPDC050556]|uniref:DUF6204 family protein n=1 Tax=Nonomuraea sp. NPDC050556 TaxID=3364369 RepID=UPI0037B30D10
MLVHDYRIMIRGRFSDLTEGQRAALLPQADDFSQVGFTQEGGLAFYSDLGPFTFRVIVTVDDAEGEKEAVDEALARAAARLGGGREGGYGHGPLDVTVTDMRDVKIRRR